MNRENITRMAREAGFVGMDGDHGALRRFAALVAANALIEPCCCNYDQCQRVCMPRATAAERERCAQICDSVAANAVLGTANECARAIRGQ